jgi:hypothetical protein
MKHYLKHPYFIYGLRVLVSVLFIVSAIFKLYTISGGQWIPAIESFEKLMVDQHIVNWCYAPIVSRMVIIAELFLGIAFLQNHYFKKFILPAMALMLIAFCIHLSYQLLTATGAENCGCMGQVIKMTSGESLLKNILTLVALVWIYLNSTIKTNSLHRYPTALLLLCSAYVWLLFPITCCEESVAGPTLLPIATTTDSLAQTNPIIENRDSITPLNKKTKIESQQKPTIKEGTPQTKVEPPKPKLNRVTSIFAPYTQYSNNIKINPDAGKKIICLFNVECDHCMETSNKLAASLSKEEKQEVYILFWGAEGMQKTFFESSKSNFPYQFVDAGKFFRLLGDAPSPPRVVVLEEGNIVGDFTSDNFSIESVKKAFHQYD